MAGGGIPPRRPGAADNDNSNGQKGVVIRMTKSKPGSGPLSAIVSGYRDKRLAINHTAARVFTVILRTVFLVGMCFVMLYPVLFMISSGFRNLQDVYDPTVVWLPKHWTLDSLKLAATAMDYGESIVMTLVTVIPSVLLQLITVLLAGYGFARFHFRGRGLLFGLLIFTIIVPVQSYIIPLFSTFTNFDFFDIGSLVGLFTGEKLTISLINKPVVFYLQAFLGMGIRSGLYIFILRQFYRGFPMELEEAAMIDGCGPMRTFLKIMLPNATSMIVTVMLFSVVWYWNDYYLSSMFYQTTFPISVKLTDLGTLLQWSDTITGYAAQELTFMREAILACGCLITVLPLLVLYVFAQRFFTEGIERSGIVG